jgi:hypothetical protein
MNLKYKHSDAVISGLYFLQCWPWKIWRPENPFKPLKATSCAPISELSRASDSHLSTYGRLSWELRTTRLEGCELYGGSTADGDTTHFYSRENIIKVIQQSLRWLGHVAKSGKIYEVTDFWLEKLKREEHLPDLDRIEENAY